MYDKFLQEIQRQKKTAYQVAKEAGIPQSTLSDWKLGRSKPKLDKLIKIAKYLGIPLEDLIDTESV